MTRNFRSNKSLIQDLFTSAFEVLESFHKRGVIMDDIYYALLEGVVKDSQERLDRRKGIPNGKRSKVSFSG